MNIQKFKIALYIVLLVTAGAFANNNFIIQLDASSDKALTAAILKVADEAFQLNLKGLDALDRRDNAGALELFSQALAIFPQYSDALNNRGVALYRRGDVAGAQRAWEDVIKRDPEYHVSYYNLGLVFMHEKKADAAMKQFELALKRNKKFTEALLRIGALHLMAGRTAAGTAEFGKAYKGDPKHQEAWNFYSYGLLLTGDTSQAITVLKSVVDNAEALAQLGRLEAGKRRYAEAAKYLSKAVELGASPAIIVDLASVQIDAGKCKDALSALSGHIAKEARPGVDVWLLAGYAARDCHGPQKALEYYEKGLKLHHRDPLLSYNAGYLYFTMKDYAQAEHVWGGIGESFSDPSLYYMRAVVARARNDLAGAERHIRKAISMDEKADYYDFLGTLRAAGGDSKGAEEHFRKALKIDPNLASAQLKLAVTGKSDADLKKAVSDAENRLSSCKDNCADAAVELSILYYHQKKHDKALSSLESVKDKDKDLRVYRHIAIYNKEMQRHDKAVAALEAAAAKFPMDMKAQYELAEAYLSAGSPSKAAMIFVDLMPKWKDNIWRLHYQLGYAYMEMNDLPAAKASFEKSMSVKKDNPAARGLLAFVLNRMGETEKAVDQWEKTVKEDGSNAAVHINLGLSYESKGQYDRALESYKKAQSIDPSDKAININLGNAYKGLDRVPEAFDSYNKGLESGKRDLAAYNIFLLSRQRNDIDRAEKMCGLLKKEFPSSIHFTRVSGEMELMKGDTSKALAAYERIKDKDRDVDDWYALARIYAGLGQRQKAEAALARIPNDGQWKSEKNVIRARLAFNSGDFKGAYQAYKEVVNTPFVRDKAEMDVHLYNMVLAAYQGKMYREAMESAGDAVKKTQGSSRTEIIRIAGNSAMAAKDWAEAKKWLGQLAAIEQGSAVAQYNFAVAHYNLGEVEDAYKQYQKARGLDRTIQNKDIETRYEQFKRGGPSSSQTQVSRGQPRNDSLDVLYNRAVDLQSAKKFDQAEKLYSNILWHDSSYSQAWNNLGAIYGARGDLYQAEAAYLNALRYQSAPEIYLNLANIYIALEDNGRALDIIARGLEKNPGNRMLARLEQNIKSGK